MLEIRIPASTSNLGPGFDVFGLALKCYLKVKVEKKNENTKTFAFKGLGAEKISASNNLILSTLHNTLKKFGRNNSGYAIRVNNSIPIGNGMGSSGTATLAGIFCANYIGNLGLSRTDILKEAVDIEGHPDNITPSLEGGFTASLVTGNGCIHFTKQRFPSDLLVALIIPEFSVSTKQAREALPLKYPLQDIISNMQRVSLFGEAIRQRKYDWIPELLKDTLHQQYRTHLVPGLKEILNIKTGSTYFGSFLSGAGPTIVALTTDSGAKEIDTIISIFKKNGITAQKLLIHADNTGVKLKETMS